MQRIKTDRYRRWPAPLPALALAVALLLPEAVEAVHPHRGFLYGKIRAASGKTYEGRLRWGREEAFWGDLFNAGKRGRYPYGAAESREVHQIHGLRIAWRRSGASRELTARFGDIRKIETSEDGQAVVVMKNGSRYEVDGGGYNDVGASVKLWDAELGEIQLRWERIKTIEFLSVPAGLEVAESRLHGTVKTLGGEFRGFIQWDRSDGVASDRLNARSADGELRIEMGRIRAIERLRRGSRVVLRDGREIALRRFDAGRGIYVEDPRFGRILVSWDAFERIDFSDPGPSGPAYDDYPPGEPLRGRVTRVDGRAFEGRILYDVDEAETWEMLNGTRDDVSFIIPFASIDAIVPRGADASRVVLRNGEDLVLEGSVDVGRGNAGVVVFEPGGERPVHVEWDEVERIDFGSSHVSWQNEFRTKDRKETPTWWMR